MRAPLRCIALAGLLATACALPRAEPRTLFDDLGGHAGIEAIVDSFLRELAADERIVHHFAETKISRFRRHLIDQLCQVSDGPCEYTGDSMADVHRGMGVSEGDFNALVEDLIDAMETEGTPTGAQNRLLARLAPMHGDIVERKKTRRARAERERQTPPPASPTP